MDVAHPPADSLARHLHRPRAGPYGDPLRSGLPDDRREGLLHPRVFDLVRDAHRVREVVWADRDHVDARHLEDRVEIAITALALDDDDRHRLLVRALDVPLALE